MDWTIWLPAVLIGAVLAAYLFRLFRERRGKAAPTQLTSGGVWTAAGLAMVLIARFSPRALEIWLLVVGLVLMLVGPWIRSRKHHPPDGDSASA